MDRLDELNLEDFEKVTGGDYQELQAYKAYLYNKFGTTNTAAIASRLTHAQKVFLIQLMSHDPSKPLPNCPDPDFHIEDWM